MINSLCQLNDDLQLKLEAAETGRQGNVISYLNIVMTTNTLPGLMDATDQAEARACLLQAKLNLIIDLMEPLYCRLRRTYFVN